MIEMRKALVVGAGAIGAAIASRLHDADPGCVALCAAGERRKRYASDGFTVNGRKYDFALADPGRDGTFDLIIVAVKNHQLAETLDEFAPFAGSGTLVLSLLNGITSEEMLRARFGEKAVPLGMIIGIDAHRSGGEVNYTVPGEIRFGDDRNDPEQPRTELAAAASFLKGRGVPCSIPADMVKALWFKFMLNVGINQWSAVMRAPYGVFQSSTAAQDLLARTMDEVVRLSDVEGRGLSKDDYPTVFSTLARLSAGGKTSMLQDVEARRKTEVEAFAGVVVSRSRACGLEAPINEALLEALTALEESYGVR